MNDLIYISVFAIFLSLLDSLTTYLFLKLNGTEANRFVSILIKRFGDVNSLVLIFFLKIFGIALILSAGSFGGLLSVSIILMAATLSNLVYCIKLVGSNEAKTQRDFHIKRPIMAITPPSPPTTVKAGVPTFTFPPIPKKATTIPIPKTIGSIWVNSVLRKVISAS